MALALIFLTPLIVFFVHTSVADIQLDDSDRPGAQLWINSTEEAVSTGLDVEAILLESCPPSNVSEMMMRLTPEEVDRYFGQDVAGALLSSYSSVVVNVTALCADAGLTGGDEALSSTPTSDRLKTTKDYNQGEQSDETGATPPPDLGTFGSGLVESGRLLHESTGISIVDDDEGLGVMALNTTYFGPDNYASVEKALRGENDTEINDIIHTVRMIGYAGDRPFASTVLLPLMKRIGYDQSVPPTPSANGTVNVRLGIHVQTLSNFQLTTMDYEMDMWLRMAWRDPRLAHGLALPVLVTEEPFLRKMWRPDAFFINSGQSLFHRVTSLNFYAYIFSEGEIFFEARLSLKPKSQLVLCKYPHDTQTVYLRISSINFRWFSRRSDAIYTNGNIQLPELYIAAVDISQCDSSRKTGNFTCVEARFKMGRNLGFYLAQTYVPTATCVLFSWISVWLPEEFVEGRIFVALTVFLTLSAESNAAKEILPKVSYVKAIDVWFGFTASFVFATMLQALAVITLEHWSQKLRRVVEVENESLSVFKATKLLVKSRRYHNLGRSLDEFFKSMYPVIMIIFLFIYVFVIIQGDENKCLKEDYR